jgi:hypothetical protein
MPEGIGMAVFEVESSLDLCINMARSDGSILFVWSRVFANSRRGSEKFG